MVCETNLSNCRAVVYVSSSSHAKQRRFGLLPIYSTQSNGLRSVSFSRQFTSEALADGAFPVWGLTVATGLTPRIVEGYQSG